MVMNFQFAVPAKMSRANEAIISQALYGPELRGNDLLYQLFCVHLIELAGAQRLFSGKISVRRSKYRKSSIKNQNTTRKSSSTRSFRSCSRGSESNSIFQLLNQPPRINPHEVLQSLVINRVYNLLVQNKQGREGGFNREGEIITFLPLKRGGGLI